LKHFGFSPSKKDLDLTTQTINKKGLHIFDKIRDFRSLKLINKGGGRVVDFYCMMTLEYDRKLKL
jgi:hypothetical protein